MRFFLFIVESITEYQVSTLVMILFIAKLPKNIHAIITSIMGNICFDCRPHCSINYQRECWNLIRRQSAHGTSRMRIENSFAIKGLFCEQYRYHGTRTVRTSFAMKNLRCERIIQSRRYYIRERKIRERKNYVRE